jgi:hypothetical protein
MIKKYQGLHQFLDQGLDKVDESHYYGEDKKP